MEGANLFFQVVAHRYEKGATIFRGGKGSQVRFGEILHAIYVEEALRILEADAGMSRKQARPVAEQLVRRLTDH